MLKLSKMGFDVKNPPEGKWLTYAKGVRLQVRKMTAEISKEIRKPHIKLDMELDPGTRRMVQVEKIKDDQAFEDDLHNYLLQDWEGVGDDDGKLLPNNAESRRIIFNYPLLRDWIWACSQQIEIADAAEQEKELGNS